MGDGFRAAWNRTRNFFEPGSALVHHVAKAEDVTDNLVSSPRENRKEVVGIFDCFAPVRGPWGENRKAVWEDV